MSRPAHLRPGLVALVTLGGTAGTAARYGVSEALPPVDGWPTATFAVNLVGALLLGALLEALVRRGPESPRGQRLRLALGTGALGGFTTFSSIAIEVERLLADGRAVLGVGYGLASVVLGFGCCLAGVAVAGSRRRRTPSSPPGGVPAGERGAA